MKTVKFYSGKMSQTVSATVLEDRATTVKLKLPDGTVIVKKKKQLIQD